MLRGPQGTLFGRNSMSGAINVITRAPGPDFYADVGASYGSYDEYKLKGVIGGPILADRLAASLSVAKADQGEGFKDNVVTGSDQDKLGFQGARVNLRWIGSEKLDARLIAYYSDAENDGFVPTALNTSTLQPITGDYYKVQVPIASRGDTEAWGVNGRVAYDFGSVTLKALSAYASTDDLFRFDLSGGIRRPAGNVVPGFDRTSSYQQDQASQELQLQSNGEGAWSWIGGLYYFTEDVTQLLSDRAFIGAIGAVIPLAPTLYDASTVSSAVFGQATWKPNERLGITFGLRYTNEDKDIAGSVGAARFTNKTSYDAVTPKLGFDFTLSDTVFLFGSASRGFKAGGFNGGGGSVIGISTPFDEENVTAYEVGAKSEWLDRRLRLNSAIYLSQYSDLQGAVIIPGTLNVITENAIDLDNYGIEFELTGVVTDQLQVFAVLGLQDENFKKLKAGTTIAASNPDRRPGVSHTQGTLGFNYSAPVAALGGSLGFGADYNYRDRFFSSPDNNRYSIASAQSRVNAYAGYTSADERWTLRLEGRNLTDETDWVNGIDLVGFLGAASRVAIEPRVWSLSARYRYE